MPLANAVASRGATTMPVSPTRAAQSPTSVTTAGTAHAIASPIAFGKLSLSDAETTMSSEQSIAGISRRSPSKVTCASSANSLIHEASCTFDVSHPRPTKRNLHRGRVATTRCAACRKRRCPFRGSRRATSPTSGSESKPRARRVSALTLSDGDSLMVSKPFGITLMRRESYPIPTCCCADVVELKTTASAHRDSKPSRRRTTRSARFCWSGAFNAPRTEVMSAGRRPCHKKPRPCATRFA